MFVTSFAEDIFNKKYAGDFRSDPESFYTHLAAMIAQGDKGKYDRYFDLLYNFRFSPGGRILAFAGRPSASVSLMNCTTHQVAGDSLDDIKDTVGTIMKASAHGQGIGMDLSLLRPMGAPVNNAAKTSTGAISFMELFNQVGGTIGQEGRRAALLFSLRDYHPDIWRKDEPDIDCPKCGGKGCLGCKGTGKVPYDFLHIKKIPGRVESANISVLVTDAFMQAVDQDLPWELRFTGETGGQLFNVVRTVQARELFIELTRSAWQSAEPGVLFLDTIEAFSNSNALGNTFKVVGTNACSEMMLDQDGVCNLGSINLAKYVLDAYSANPLFSYRALAQDVGTAVEFLDDVNELELLGNRSISEGQRISILNLRRVGLGVMGLADTLVRMGLRYDTSERTITFLRNLFATLRNAAYLKSVDLAERKGPCLAWADLDKNEREEVLEKGFYKTLPIAIKRKIVQSGLRNTTLLSIAPTGSISNLCGVSSGIEPLFALEYVRRVRMSGEDKFITYVHPGVTETRSLGLPDCIWDTAYEVSATTHVEIQAVIQEYIDSAIAKTTNLPANATVKDVADVYMLAWKRGLKGITVYRDASREEQVLYHTEETDETCPNCGSPVIKHGGCTECPSCGWGKCG